MPLKVMNLWSEGSSIPCYFMFFLFNFGFLQYFKIFVFERQHQTVTVWRVYWLKFTLNSLTSSILHLPFSYTKISINKWVHFYWDSSKSTSCSVCWQLPAESNWKGSCFKGKNTYRKPALDAHDESCQHLQCVLAERAVENLSATQIHTWTEVENTYIHHCWRRVNSPSSFTREWPVDASLQYIIKLFI